MQAIHCPPEIASVLLNILTVGLLRIRASASYGEFGRCAIEADHIHNLPHILRDFSRPLLNFYWDVERASFLAQTTEEQLGGLGPLWGELEPYITPRLE